VSRREAEGLTLRRLTLNIAIGGACLAALAPAGLAQSRGPHPIRGLSSAPALARAYDAILNADFDQVTAHLVPACIATPTWCAVMESVALWWRIALDPDDLSRDAAFLASAEDALLQSEDWTQREPHRAEAWFAQGAAYAARAQWRTERRARLSAARDGKHIKAALERALDLDPALDDAKFGLGMYRYYAAMAPPALRLFRWLLLLPGGDRRGGLQQMLEARDQGVVVRGEADYQLHLIYLWYENRPHDALALLRSLQQRYPRNPLFVLREADVHHRYFHDAAMSAARLCALIARAAVDDVNHASLAARRARAALAALDASPRD
jgi:hypothetical protein